MNFISSQFWLSRKDCFIHLDGISMLFIIADWPVFHFSLLQVKAYDADTGVNGLVRYSISGNAPVTISNDGIVSLNANIE